MIHRLGVRRILARHLYILSLWILTNVTYASESVEKKPALELTIEQAAAIARDRVDSVPGNRQHNDDITSGSGSISGIR